MPKKMIRTHRACERYEIDPDGLTGRGWAQLITFDASYSEKCDWTKLDGYDWTRLLVKHPEYAHRCDWASLDFDNWNVLLKKHPEFAKHISFDQWLELIPEYPEFAECYDICNMSETQWEKVFAASKVLLVGIGTGSKGVPVDNFTRLEWLALYGVRRYLKLVGSKEFKRTNCASARHRQRDQEERGLWKWYENNRRSE